MLSGLSASDWGLSDYRNINQKFGSQSKVGYSIPHKGGWPQPVIVVPELAGCVQFLKLSFRCLLK